MSNQVKQIMEQVFEEQGQPTLRKFAEWLMEDMSKDGDRGTITHPAIINWKNGQPPSTDLLEDLLAVYPVSDGRFLFALRMLAAKSPHVWGSDGIVWTLKKNLLPEIE